MSIGPPGPHYPYPGVYPGPCTEVAWYAARFSFPVDDGILSLRSTTHTIYSRNLRIRGADEGYFEDVRVGGKPMLIGDLSFAAFSDPLGSPVAPRSVRYDEDPAKDDSSDGPPIDWAAFSDRHELRMWIGGKGTAHMILTFSAYVSMNSAVIPPPRRWPSLQFRWQDSPWNNATVVDYRTRNGEPDEVPR